VCIGSVKVIVLNKQTNRRLLVAVLVCLGAVMIFLATNALVGVLLMALGIVIEVIGIAMKRK
jgi:hypothetical protein